MGIIFRILILGFLAYMVGKALRRLLAPPPGANGVGVDPESFDKKDPYEVLGVSKAASQEEIKRAYKEALSQYHPDKVEHLGEDLKILAQKKSQQINEAYKTLMR